MPNGRRSNDPVADFKSILLDLIKESENFELHRDFGATTIDEGEARLTLRVDPEKYPNERFFIWMNEYCTWGNMVTLRNGVKQLQEILDRHGIDYGNRI